MKDLDPQNHKIFIYSEYSVPKLVYGFHSNPNTVPLLLLDLVSPKIHLKGQINENVVYKNVWIEKWE